jgi:hypothetical protein
VPLERKLNILAKFGNFLRAEILDAAMSTDAFDAT